MSEVKHEVLLQAKGIYKNFETSKKDQAVHALTNVDLTLYRGETLALVGESGCGKSTLGRTLIRMLPATRGSVTFEGRNITAMKDKEFAPLRRRMQMVFQDPYASLDPRMKVRDIIAEPLETYHVCKTKAETTHRVLELMQAVGVPAEFLNRYPHQFSGGQRQRIGIARAIVSNPSVLLSDEATSALDPETVKSILQLLKDINKKLGITIVMITHQMEVIKEIAQHVAVIEHGKIIEEGSVINLFTNPQTETLKKFVGSVMSSELPAQLSHMNIHPTKKHESDNILISLSFRGDVTNEPIIAQLIKKYNLNVSILYGSIDYIQDISFGRLLIMISGHLEDLTDALTHLNALPITSEVIGYVSRNN